MLLWSFSIGGGGLAVGTGIPELIKSKPLYVVCIANFETLT